MTNKASAVNVSSLDALAGHGINRVCLAIGVFDGVHCGHQLLLRRLLAMSKAHHAVPVAMTFFPHPRQVLQPQNAPSLLLPPEQKVILLHEFGMHGVVTVPFSREFAALPPEEFISDCLNSPRVEICGICVGEQWRFGAGGKGGSGLLRQFAFDGHFEFDAVAELAIDGNIVSSTNIRRAISSGLLEHAKVMLGRPYSLFGKVEKGFHLAGAELAHPTANIRMEYGILPPDGVYAAKAVIGGVKLAAAVNIGISPTYHRQDSARRVEVHILDFNRDLYGLPLEVELILYLREERCFSDTAGLKAQIELDVTAIKDAFKT
jgi:riboflavin kinase/FMN adenylyltransferase